MKTVTIPTSKEIAEYRRMSDERFELLKELTVEERQEHIYQMLTESHAISVWELELRKREFAEKYPALNYDELKKYFILS